MKKIFLTVTVLILVAISLISITACKNDFSEKDMHGYSAKEAVVKESDDLVIVENVDDMIVTEAWYFTSGMPNNAITAKYYGEEGENVIFTFSTGNGSLRNKNGAGRTLDVGVDETLYWSPDEDTTEAQGTEIKIILKIGEQRRGLFRGSGKDGSVSENKRRLSKRDAGANGSGVRAFRIKYIRGIPKRA